MKKRAWRSLLSLVLAFTMVFTIWTPALAKSEAAGEWDPSAEYKLLTVDVYKRQNPAGVMSSHRTLNP